MQFIHEIKRKTALNLPQCIACSSALVIWGQVVIHFFRMRLPLYFLQNMKDTLFALHNFKDKENCIPKHWLKELPMWLLPTDI